MAFVPFDRREPLERSFLCLAVSTAAFGIEALLQRADRADIQYLKQLCSAREPTFDLQAALQPEPVSPVREPFELSFTRPSSVCPVHRD